ncbi:MULTISPECIES: phospholipase D-like domain-containing protein [Bacillus cereus group]|uniref:phospholipase D-like domain-containing protein n=1 Tax=Bacillus cereus group TaxID=86661 RepID=UPI000BF35708|nr:MULTISPECIES: phospholipase D-like domain-containing protein [Bacillus cereus group]MBT2200673.1 cardiolipin synthase [Bacillus thuringiensis]MDA2235726.1 phospholipase D-like domain-containing protein [Bacillus cereus]PFQ22600.1 cardiolipin synthase [Bacillus cereus]BCA32225.1 cardiolipin synthetase [Bacillus wiedmannii]
MLKKIRRIFRVFLFLFIGGCLVLFVWGEIDRTIAEKNGVFSQNSSQYPMRQSDIILYTDGKQLNNQLFSDIEQAKHYVHVNFFSIADDKVSHQFLELLRKKSQEGVEVYYALDRLGGILLKKKERELLVKKGVHFTYYNKPAFPYLFSSLDHRNHRRISVIDGKVGYIGGFNIGKKYLGEKEKLGYWRDYHLQIRGEGVQDLEQQFVLDWKRNSEKPIPIHNAVKEKGATSQRFTAYYSGEKLEQDYKMLFQQAKESIIILTPYFIPKDRTIWNALVDARKRGVRVKILFSPHSDALLVKEAAYPYIRKALKQGMEVYGYKNGVLHGKVFLIDEKVLMVGTVNFDSRSFHLNEEMNCYIHDPIYISRIKPVINADLQNSKQVTSSDVNQLSIKEKIKEKVAKMFEYYL